MGDVYRFPGGDMPPDFETRLPQDIQVRYCYRHPDRETGVSCSNCGRPICHECMIPAAVGFRCPECVKEQRASGSRAKVVTRGQMRSRWNTGALGMSRGLTVTKVLVAINVLVFVLYYFHVPVIGPWIDRYGAMSAPAVILDHQYWRMFTALFLHAGIFHILFNMWALWVIGAFLEATVGKVKFLLLYFISGFAGSVLVLATLSLAPVVGASGAIFGLFGALAVHAYFNRNDFQSQAFLRQILFLIVFNLLITFTFGGISWQAHVGGLIAGGATMFAMMLGGRKDVRRPFEMADGLAVAGVVLVLVLVTAWRVLTVTVM